MDVKVIRIDFSRLRRPLTKGIATWVKEEGITLPCLLLQKNLNLSPAHLNLLKSAKENLISATFPSYHPYLFAVKNLDTGAISFPFREDIGVGKRRQDFEPIYLFLDRYALIRDLSSPLKPHLIVDLEKDKFQTHI